MMEIIKDYASELLNLSNEMSPYLLLGFLIAGILHVTIDKDKIVKYLGENSLKSALYAAIIGIPLPLCSCGVIPTGVSFYKEGASKSATVSFLISTPQTGVDSILVTYSMLGLPFAIIRPIVALFSGLLGGILTTFTSEKEKPTPATLADASFTIDHSMLNTSPDSCGCENECKTKKTNNKFIEIFRYAFIDFMEDIAKWLLIGLLLAALISIAIPDDFFTMINSSFLGILIILIASIPLYICATSSVPLAAVLLLKGLSPGAVLVFLMAGPATNIATITVLSKSIGKRATISYLATIIFSAIIFGLFIDSFLPPEWFAINSNTHMDHEHSLLPAWLEISSTIILMGTLVNALFKKYNILWYNRKTMDTTENSILLQVEGMTCNHCKTSVEKQMLKQKNVDSVTVDLSSGKVTVVGKKIDVSKLEIEIESLGYSVIK